MLLDDSENEDADELDLVFVIIYNIIIRKNKINKHNKHVLKNTFQDILNKRPVLD